MRVAGDTEQPTVDTEMDAMYSERTVIVVDVTTTLCLVEQLRRLELVQHLKTHYNYTIDQRHINAST